jgi:copper chaperone
MTNIKIRTEGMHCPSCEMLVVDSLEELDGVSCAAAYHEEGIVSVEFDDSKVSVDDIKKTITDEGYKVK